MNQISLNGSWRMVHCPIGEYDNSMAAEALNNHAIAYKVPGSVQRALVTAKVLPEPYTGLNQEKFQVVETLDFWCATTFEADEALVRAGGTLCFDGLDLNADIYLNGHLVGHSENAFLRAEICVKNRLKLGANEVLVRLNEGLAGVRGKTLAHMKYSWNQEEPYRSWMRKPQYCYGWDWAKRMSSCGIYLDVTLRTAGDTRLAERAVRTAFAADFSSAEISIEEAAGFPEGYRLEAKLYTDERFESVSVAAAGEAALGERLTLTLTNPKLWYPNGCGKPYLYRLSLTVFDEAGKTVDSCDRFYGLRTVSLDESPSGNGRQHFTFMVNGMPIFAKGANWVPIEQLAGDATCEKYQALVAGAKDMGMNMFRVWGGGYYETEDFFDACDREGILVWHDFMFACGYYPDFDPLFVANVEAEARYQIKRLRNRTCFVGWSGNNENHSMHESILKYHNKQAVFYGGTLYDELLPRLCKELDPTRSYRPSSPSGGGFADDPNAGDQHLWAYNQIGNEKYMDLYLYPETPCTFLSEFGIIAPMNLESLRRCVEPEALVPQSEQWLWHSNIGDYFDTVLETFYGKKEPAKTVPLDQYILMGQAVQATCIRSTFESYRARAFDCSGVLLWMYSDCYPTSGWTFMDYYLNKKPLYYATKRAFSPLGICFTGRNPNERELRVEKQSVMETGITLVNDFHHPVTLKVQLTLWTLDGRKLQEQEETVKVAANSTKALPPYQFKEVIELVDADQLVLSCKVSDEAGNHNENSFFPAAYGDLKLKRGTVSIATKKVGETLELTLRAESYVWMLHLAGDQVQYSDNDFDLFPGETRTITVTGACEGFVPEWLSMNDCLS